MLGVLLVGGAAGWAYGQARSYSELMERWRTHYDVSGPETQDHRDALRAWIEVNRLMQRGLVATEVQGLVERAEAMSLRASMSPLAVVAESTRQVQAARQDSLDRRARVAEFTV